MRLVGLRAVQHPQGLPSYYRSLQELYGTVGGTGDKILLGSNGEESKVRVEQSRPPLPAKKRQRNKRKPGCSSLSQLLPSTARRDTRSRVCVGKVMD